MGKEWLIVYGHGVKFQVRNRELIINYGFPALQDRQETILSRGTNAVSHLVLTAFSGTLSVDSLHWLMQQNILVSVLDDWGNLLTSFCLAEHISPVVKRRQATANWSLNGKLACWLLSDKLAGQRKVLEYIRNNYHRATWWTAERAARIDQAAIISMDRAAALPSCPDADSMRVLEAQAAAAYWHCFEGIPLAWRQASKIPAQWKAIGNRTSPKTGGPRKAVDPFNAGLNYCYAILEGLVKQACLVQGIDPDFGIIHADRQDRASLIFDLMEPLRPEVDRLLFDWCISRKFDPKDFFETREGICKVGAEITKQIIPLVKELDNDVTAVVKEFAGYFKNKWTVQKPEEFKETGRPGTIKLARPKQLKLTFKDSQPVNERQIKVVSAGREEKICLECGKAFIPNNNRQKFCCVRHKDRYKRRQYREQRIKEGRCPECGRPMPEPAAGTYKEKLTYCEHCRDYWKRQYKKKKAH